MQKTFNIIFLLAIIFLAYTSITGLMKINKMEKESANKPPVNPANPVIQENNQPLLRDITAQDFSSAIRSKLREQVSEVNIKFDK